MPRVAIADLQVGAVLSQPVYSPRGILLAPAGTALTEAHLNVFASWGVVEANVASVDEPAAPSPTTRQLDATELYDIHKLIEDRFSLVVPLNPFMREMRRVAEVLLIRRRERTQPEEH